ncbi:MAG: hypothetical protein KI791_09960 [Cyclobacteriaceae bacterium]|nr:hypothetical protein [Cyclobacteriaceae bacterium SS2]
MKPQLKATGNFTQGNKTANFQNVPVFVIREDDTTIYYTPVFDISGYGYDDTEAEKSLQVAINEFFRYTLNKKTFSSELLKLGWKQLKKKKYLPPVMSEMVKERDYLSEIIDSHDFSKKSLDVAMPVA